MAPTQDDTDKVNDMNMEDVKDDTADNNSTSGEATMMDDDGSNEEEIHDGGSQSEAPSVVLAPAITVSNPSAAPTSSRRSLPSRAAKTQGAATTNSSADGCRTLSSGPTPSASSEPRRSSRRRTPPPFAPTSENIKTNEKSSTSSSGKKQDTTDEKKKKNPEPNDENYTDDSEEEALEAPVSETTYTWLDEGTIPSRGGGGNISHDELEIRQGDLTIVVKVGDSILLRSEQDEFEFDDDEDEDDTDDAEGSSNPNSEASRRQRERAILQEHEAAYIALVESMWEEQPAVTTRRSSQSNNKSTNPLRREHRMKMRTRWFFKRDDIANLKRGKPFLMDESSSGLNISTHKELLKYMTNRDIILSDQCDDNDVLTILDKCRVIQRKPRPLPDSALSKGSSSVIRDPDPFPANVAHSVYRSRFSLSFEGGGRQHNTILSAYQGEDEDWPKVSYGLSPLLDRKIAAFAATAAGGSTTGKVEEDAAEEKEDQGQDGKVLFPSEDTTEANDSKQSMASSEAKGAKESTSTPMADTSPMMSTEDEAKDVAMQEEKEEDRKDGDEEMQDVPMSPCQRSSAKSAPGASIHGGESERAGTIKVGPSYQASVPVWTGEGSTKPTSSRLPILVWSARTAAAKSETEKSRYWKGAARILVPHMEFHKMLLEEAPRGTLVDPTQPKLVREDLLDRSEMVKSISQISTASVMMASASNNAKDDGVAAKAQAVEDETEDSAKTDVAVDDAAAAAEKEDSTYGSDPDELPSLLPRECDVDELLCNLHVWNYDPDAALLVVDRNPNRFITGWKQQQRDTFNTSFRRFDGIVRHVANALKGEKNHKEVVDYYYRFKIPMQYRLYQEKKRRDAIEMMEKLEQKRKDAFNKRQSEQEQQLEDSLLFPSSTGVVGLPIGESHAAAEIDAARSSKRRKTSNASRPSAPDWSRMSVQDAMKATNERKQAAMRFIMKVGTECGQDVMMEVVERIAQMPSREKWEKDHGTDERNATGETFKEIEERMISELKASCKNLFSGSERDHLYQEMIFFLPEEHRWR